MLSLPPGAPKITPIKNMAMISRANDDAYRKIHFAVMAIESGAKRLNISGQEMEQRLRKQDLIHLRLIGQYEMLHTQSLEYVSEDITETLLNWEQSKD